MGELTSVELCAGGGGQSLGLEMAGFHPLALVENDKWACETLRTNRRKWNVCEQGVETFDAMPYRGADLVAAGVPCPPFSKAGKQLGRDDERDLFPEAIRVVSEVMPRAVLFENVRGLLDPRFDEYREDIEAQLGGLGEHGYQGEWKLVFASDYGVPQLRPRVLFVATRRDCSPFVWPEPNVRRPKTVGETLWREMAQDGWEGAKDWRKIANDIAPTLVGGSKKHGGPDLGPTRAKKKWADLGVNGMTLGNEPPQPGFVGAPRLTVQMAARIQGFPKSWKFVGPKTHAYRQVGNAFPPPVACAVGTQIRAALERSAPTAVAMARNFVTA